MRVYKVNDKVAGVMPYLQSTTASPHGLSFVLLAESLDAWDGRTIVPAKEVALTAAAAVATWRLALAAEISALEKRLSERRQLLQWTFPEAPL